jgi:hypothetical protein
MNNVDNELKKIIDEYADVILAIRPKIEETHLAVDTITSKARSSISEVQKKLDEALDSGDITESEYLMKFRSFKERILKKTEEDILKLKSSI